MFWFVRRSYFFSILWYSVALLSVMENLFFFQLYWSIKGLIFDILSGWLLICWWFNATVKAYWKQLSSLFLRLIVLFYFLAIQENLYMIHFFSNLFSEGGNTINQYYQEQTRFLSLIFLNLFDNFVRDSKSFSIISSVLLPIIISIL